MTTTANLLGFNVETEPNTFERRVAEFQSGFDGDSDWVAVGDSLSGNPMEGTTAVSAPTEWQCPECGAVACQTYFKVYENKRLGQVASFDMYWCENRHAIWGDLYGPGEGAAFD